MSRYRMTILAAFLLATSVAVPATAQRAGVQLFSDTDFRGRSLTFETDIADLGNTPFGNDRASSIALDRGCRAILFEGSNFRGRSVEITGDVADLGRTPVGNDRASSMRVRCHRDEWSHLGRGGDRDRGRDWNRDQGRDGDRGRDRGRGGDWDRDRDRDGWGRDDWRGREGVILYADEGYRGRSSVITRDLENLRHVEIGNDRASSIRVAPGCEAILYSDERFSGRAASVDRDEPELGRTRVGNDALSSIEVRCRNGGRDRAWEDGVTVYSDTEYQGRSVSFDRDVADFGRTELGNDRASSIRVPVGCVAELFEHEDFRGRSVRLDRDVDALGATPLGNDRLSSMRVRCGRRR